MQDHKPKASIIIVNWNGVNYLEECLSSVHTQTYENYEIVFVDNGSKDGSVEFVADNFPETKVIRNETNLGFAEGNNIGIRASDGDYIATLNNDTKVDPKWLKELVKVAEGDNGIGSCASKMLRYDDWSVIDSTGIELFPTGAVRDRGSGEKDNGQYDKEEEVFGACAGAALYRMQMLRDIGLFPGHYFASYEDVALAWRARYAGWKCVYVPSALVYHKRFATQNVLLAESESFRIQKARNQLWYQIEYLPGKHLAKNLSRLARAYVRLVLMATRNGTSGLGKALMFLPSVLRQRYVYQGRKELDRAEIFRWLEHK